MTPKIVPASGERDAQGKKKRAPKKYKGPYHHAPVSRSEALKFHRQMLEHLESAWLKKLKEKTGTVEQATHRLGPIRMTIRVMDLMTDQEFLNIQDRGFCKEDYQGKLF